MTKQKRWVSFFDPASGREQGKVRIVETGVNARGNRHYNTRRPLGPVCECGEPWKPVCSNFKCPGSRVPRSMIRAEKQDAGTKRFPGHPELVKAERERNRVVRRTRDDTNARSLEAKGGRHRASHAPHRARRERADVGAVAQAYARAAERREQQRKAA